jgi:hypothetical protein
VEPAQILSSALLHPPRRALQVDKKKDTEMIYIYRDAAGACKGDATLTYEDPDAASR